MPPETTDQHVYFDTRARAERLQLVRHLVRNANETIYLRGPKGAGKTRFTRRLLESFDDETAVVWLDAAVEDMPGTVAHELGLPQAAALQWPTGTLAGIGDRDLILIVDDAHRLGPGNLQHLLSMHGAGGKLLLIGQGGVGEALEGLAPRFVDLPGFSSDESAAFLRLGAGQLAERVTDELARKAHQDAGGLPGPLLDVLSTMAPAAMSTSSESGSKSKPASPASVWRWFVVATGVALLAAVLVFQDHINALVDPPQHEMTLSKDVAVIERQPADPRTSEEGDPPDGESSRAPDITLPELSTPARANEETTDRDDETAQEGDTVSESGKPDEMIKQEPASVEDPLDAVLEDALSAVADDPQSDDPVVSTDASIQEMDSPAALELPTDADSGDESVEVTASQQQVVERQVSPTKRPSVDEQQERKVELASKSEIVKEVVIAPEPEPAKPEREPVVVAAPTVGDAWLSSREPARYTLQMVGGRERNSLERFIRRNGIKPPYAIFERDLEGSPWYSLVAGDYADRDAAVAARVQLPRRLQNSGVWPRTFESIFKSK